MRLVPHRSLPPYAFVPGQSPHPVSDPRGHSHGAAHREATLDPERWQECEEYLFGFDLFNAGFYWEAHEAWEACWHAVGRVGPVADVLKGLIRLAACGVKAREGRADGVTSHAAAAARLFRGIEGRARLGLDTQELARLADRGTADFKVVPKAARFFMERIDDTMVRVLGEKTPAERLAIANRMWHAARDLVRADIIRTHPEYDEQQIAAGVARRMARGSA
ncbi:MAG: DUF309 domain-containing protein [Gemmataceae bacterium]|nr:DUF309 domain-containing protein [Gemmataceae bacterium]